MKDAVRWPRRWPVAVISLPAAVATWSGWVGLGEMTGFGKVKLLPGLWDELQVNTAVTLPIGVEAYAAFALSAALTSAPVADVTRRFAWISSVSALSLGAGAQVAYHLLTSMHRTAAPWQITTAVSCLPVLVLGLGAVLAHLLHRDRTAAALEVAAVPVPAEAAVPVPVRVPAPVAEVPAVPVPDRDEVPAVPVPAEEPVPIPAEEPAPVPDPPNVLLTEEVPEVPEEDGEVPVPVPGSERIRAAKEFATEIAAGKVPGIKTIKERLHVGQPKAGQVQAYLKSVLVRTESA